MLLRQEWIIQVDPSWRHATILVSDTLGPQEVPGLFVDQNVITGAAGKGKEKSEQAGDLKENMRTRLNSCTSRADHFDAHKNRQTLVVHYTAPHRTAPHRTAPHRTTRSHCWPRLEDYWWSGITQGPSVGLVLAIFHWFYYCNSVPD